MRSDPRVDSFDCVASMREARDRIDAEIAGMSYDELERWLRTKRYSDPVLQRLADRVSPPAGSTGRPQSKP